jgi:outer membrane protein TolC
MGGNSGNPGLSDLYRIQMEAGELKYSLASLKNQLITISAQFNNYLKRPQVTPVSVPDTIPLDTLTLSLGSVSDSIHANNPMLSMIELEQKSLDARKKMVRGMGYPMVGLGLDYSIIGKSEMSTSSMNGKDMIMPMVSITLPVYRKKYKAMIAETELLKTAAKNSYDATANDLESEYYRAIEQYQDARRRLILYSNQYDLASRSLDIMIKGFASSASSLTDLLRVRQQTLDYELKLTEARADLNSASALLRKLMASLRIN